MLRYFVLIIVLLPASALANDGPISSWDFDGDLTDTRGRAKDDFSAASGQVRFVNADDLPGVEGQAVAIGVESGDAPYFTAPSSVDTQLGPAYTIEAWIHPTQISDSWNRLVLGWGHERAYHFAVRDGAIDLHHAQADRVERSCSGGCIKPHYWYHVAAIAARNEADPEASKLAVYVNGEKVASTTFDGTIHVRENGPIGLGDSADAPSGTIGFKGYVDSVTVFNRPLTDAEIHQRCERRRDILGQSSWGLALKKRWKTESRLAVAIELEKLAREQDMGDDMMDVAAEMLDDRDPFVRAMAEWAIARKVARDNNHEQVTWTADSESPWLKKYLAIPTAERVEMDW